MAKITISVIKADVGSVGGHTQPHPKMIEMVKNVLRTGVEKGILFDFCVSRVGDDINLIMTHDKGDENSDIHTLAWNTFKEATEIAKQMKLYGAGQDLLSDAFSGNVKGMGPGYAELTFEPRKSEPIMILMADKTEPSAFSLPLCRTYADPFTTTGLVIDPRLKPGFRFEVWDLVDRKRITLSTPEELHELLALLSDTTRYAIKHIYSKDDAIGIAVAVSTERLSFIAGKYVGKDDPVAVARCQAGLPSVGETLQPFAFPALVAGWMRGSHNGPLYPSAVEDANPSFFDGPPRIAAIGLQLTDGKLYGLENPKTPPGEHIPIDYFSGSCWDYVRHEAMERALYIRGHGPFMPATLPPEEMEYTTKVDVLNKLKPRMEEID
jgi:fructose 1,6-bisphosphate aldolase/phosphatase